MKFLSGLLKTVSVLLMLAATVMATAVIVLEGIDSGVEEAIWVSLLAWVGVMIGLLAMFGTGMALGQVYKLKKRVEVLEMRPVTVAAPQYAPVVRETQAPVSEAVQEAAPQAPQAPVATAEIVEEKKKVGKKWLPAAIAGAAVLVIVIVVILVAGGKDKPGTVAPEGTTGLVIGADNDDTQSQDMPGIDATPVALGESIDNEMFTMTFDSVEVLGEFSYRTSEHSTTSLYVEEGYQLLLMKGHFTNNSMQTIEESAFVKSATINGDYVVDGYDVRMDFLRSKSFEIDPYTDLDYVMYVNIPEKLAAEFETVTFTFGYKDDLSIPTTTWNADGTKTTDAENYYSITSGATVAETAEAPAEEYKWAYIGETIYTDEYEFTLRNVEMSYEVLPPDTSSVYVSYPAESGKVYVHVEADVKNVMQRDIRIDELFTAGATYDWKYPYEGFTIVNDGDVRFDWVGSYVAATPLETCRAHSLIECPAEVDTSGNSVIVNIEIGDETYYYVLR